MLDAIRRQVAAWIDPERRQLGISPRTDPSFFGGIFGRSTLAGTRINEGSALGITPFWRGVNLYASTIAALSLEVVERNPRGGYFLSPDSPAYDLIHSRPNRTTPKLHFWQSLISHALTFRGGYAEIEWSVRGRKALGLHIMDPRNVTPIFNEDRTVQYKIDASGTKLDSSDVIHIRGLGFNGIEGYSLVEIGREMFGLAKAQQSYESATFGNGAQMGGMIKFPGTKTEPQLREFRKNLDAIHGGPDKAGKTGFLTDGAEWVRTNFSPVDAAIMQSRGFSVAEVSRLMGIPLHMLGVMEGATVGNAEQQALQFIKFSLLPWLKAIEGELDLKLFSSQERRRFAIRHDTRGLERGDSAARTAYYRGLFDMGAITPNQIMLGEGMEPSVNPNADKHFIPANNLVALEDWDGKPTQPAASKPKEPDPDGNEPASAEGTDAPTGPEAPAVD